MATSNALSRSRTHRPRRAGGCGGRLAALLLGLVFAVTAAPAGAQLFPPGEPIPVAGEAFPGALGQLGGMTGFYPNLVGVIDAFGNGPYDLMLEPNRLYPWKGFTEDGTPRYGEPIILRGPVARDGFVAAPDGRVLAVAGVGKTIRVAQFDKGKRAFVRLAESGDLDIPAGIGGRLAAHVSEDGKLHVFFVVSDGVAYHASDHHPHDHAYVPFNGAGFWRGGLPRTRLYYARFDSPQLQRVEAVGRPIGEAGESLFGSGGQAIVNLGPGHERDVLVSEKLGTFRLFGWDGRGDTITDRGYLNTADHVALRHPVIGPGAKPIPDPATGLSNLIVTDTGRVWFYRFTGRFSPAGGPIFEGPTPVLHEGAHLALGALPVISPGDVDGDGRIDLIAGNDAGQLLFVRNVGDATRPAFDNPVAVPVGGEPLLLKAGYAGSVQGPGEATWGYTCPTLYDWNGDGRLDVLLNSITGEIRVLLQLPGRPTPAFTEPRQVYCQSLDLRVSWRNQPGVTDWGTPGQACLIALDEENRLRRYWRIDDQNVRRGELLRLTTGDAITANDEGAGQTGRAKLQVVDWDGDGALDLLVGTSRGLSFPASATAGYPDAFGAERAASVLLLRNAGSNADPVFEYARLLQHEGERIRLGIHSCTPAAVDLGRGQLDLLVGEERGSVRYYPRESLSLSPPHGEGEAAR